MSAPIAWANATTPAYATVLIGNIAQTENFTSDGATPLEVGFQSESSWSDKISWTATDPSGIEWECNRQGIYNLRAVQSLAITAPPAVEQNITVIPTSTFFFDVSGVLTAPQIGSALLHPIILTQSSISKAELAPTSDVLMGTFVTPVGFLTSLIVPGAPWDLSIWASTTDEDEVNNMYLRVYEVDADGISDPVLIFNGGAGVPFIVNGGAIVNYNSTVNIPTFEVASLTRRLQFRLYANFGAASTITFYTRDLTVSSIRTSVSQDVVVPVKDVVALRISVESATTTEFTQTLETSIPVSIAPGETIDLVNSVSGYASVDVGATMKVTVTSLLGNFSIVSGAVVLPAPQGVLGWNLIAQGPYGNAGVIV